jgi:hypothetical protein
MSADRSFVVHAEPRAAAPIGERGLRADDIACVPAAAGGPKRLAPIELDKRLFDPRQGGLDRFLPWRRRPRRHPWLDNVLLLAPAAQSLAQLPGGKLPERNDVHRYGLDHTARARDWRRAIAESESFADDVLGWLQRPDPTLLRPL